MSSLSDKATSRFNLRFRVLWGTTLTALLCISPTMNAATFRSIDDPSWPNAKRLLLSGVIDAGDSRKLLQVLHEAKTPFRWLQLNSPGGSLDEALRMAKILEQLNIRTSVDGICASACFFVWLAGAYRSANGVDTQRDLPSLPAVFRSEGMLFGKIGLHRPYQAQIQAPSPRQPQLMRAVSEYLDSKLVPRRLIDIMMSRPSNDIYWMTSEDITDVGQFNASLEEYLIQKCGFDRNLYQKWMRATDGGRTDEAELLSAAIRRSADCEEDVLDQLQIKGLASVKKLTQKP